MPLDQCPIPVFGSQTAINSGHGIYKYPPTVGFQTSQTTYVQSHVQSQNHEAQKEKPDAQLVEKAGFSIHLWQYQIGLRTTRLQEVVQGFVESLGYLPH